MKKWHRGWWVGGWGQLFQSQEVGLKTHFVISFSKNINQILWTFCMLIIFKTSIVWICYPAEIKKKQKTRHCMVQLMYDIWLLKVFQLIIESQQRVKHWIVQDPFNKTSTHWKHDLILVVPYFLSDNKEERSPAGSYPKVAAFHIARLIWLVTYSGCE